MAFSLQPAYGQGGSYTAQADRLLLASMTNTSGVRVITPKSGTTMTGDLAVNSSGTTDAKVSVSAGSVIIPWTSTTGQGYYHAYNDGALASGVFAANSSGSSRIDLVSIQVTDTGATPSVAVVITQGTTSPPATPSNAVPLAQVTIPNGFTTSTQVLNSNIADVRPKAFVADLSVSGTGTGVIPSPSRGQLVYVADNTISEGLQAYNGTAWRKPWNMPWGYVGRTELATSFSQSSTADFDVTGMSVTFTALANRFYRVTAFMPAVQRSTGVATSFNIYNGVSKLQGGVVDGSNSASFDVATPAHLNIITTFSAGSVTLKCSVTIAGGSGTMTVAARGGTPYISVEDIGPSGVPA